MKVFLLHRDRDFSPEPNLRDAVFDAMVSGHLWALANVRRNFERQRNLGLLSHSSGPHDVLAQDLELDTLWGAMAAGDEFLFETAKRVVMSSLRDPAAIIYRQEVLADCLGSPLDRPGALSRCARGAGLRTRRGVTVARRGTPPDPPPLGAAPQALRPGDAAAASDRRRAARGVPLGGVQALFRGAP